MLFRSGSEDVRLVRRPALGEHVDELEVGEGTSLRIGDGWCVRGGRATGEPPIDPAGWLWRPLAVARPTSRRSGFPGASGRARDGPDISLGRSNSGATTRGSETPETASRCTEEGLGVTGDIPGHLVPSWGLSAPVA